MLAERDVVRGLARHGDGFLRLRAHDVAMGHPATCRIDDDITAVMVRMTHTRQRPGAAAGDAGVSPARAPEGGSADPEAHNSEGRPEGAALTELLG